MLGKIPNVAVRKNDVCHVLSSSTEFIVITSIIVDKCLKKCSFPAKYRCDFWSLQVEISREMTNSDKKLYFIEQSKPHYIVEPKST